MNRYVGAWWFIGALAAGFIVTAATSSGAEVAEGKRQLSWRKTEASLALLNSQKVVWQFNHLGDGSEKGCPFFHPLATLDGAVLTDFRPRDHLWHRGLRFSWKIINGVDDYWAWPEGKQLWPEKEMGETEVKAVSAIANDDYSAVFELQLSYHPPDKPADLTEKLMIRVSAPDRDGSYMIDWRSVFTAGDRGAVLDRTPILGEQDGKWYGGYAGLQLRLPYDQLSGWMISNSEGIQVTQQSDTAAAERRKSLQPIHGMPARWLNLVVDRADGMSGGVTIFDHPKNLRHPTPWHVVAMPKELHQAPLFESPYTLPAGKDLRFWFRVLVHSGVASKSELDWRWKEFAASE